jgi:hypothetical protein
LRPPWAPEGIEVASRPGEETVFTIALPKGTVERLGAQP